MSVLGMALVAAGPLHAQYSSAVSLTASSSQGDTGDALTVSASGVDPNSTVGFTFNSTPVFLGSATASAAGVATLATRVPAGVGAGTHTITAAAFVNGQPVTLSTVFRVLGVAGSGATSGAAAGAVAGEGLARTGFDWMPWARTGLMLVALGGLVVSLARRRQPGATTA